MQIVIKIPDFLYQIIQDCKVIEGTDEGTVENVLVKAVENGVVLPKGHGRILDEKDILDTENNSGGWYDLTDMPEYIAGVKAIIGADKESEEV